MVKVNMDTLQIDLDDEDVQVPKRNIMMLVMLFLALLAVEFLVLVFIFRTCTRKTKGPGQGAKTMIVLGSGGHTAEMLKLIDAAGKDKYYPRVYVVAETDALSGQKALAKEKIYQGTENPALGLFSIPRSREVGQSYITSIGTTLYSMLYSFALLWNQSPDLLLVNGPGTCIPLCAAVTVFRFLGLLDCKIVYVESIARTKRFSLSAKILYHLRWADVLFVQWEQLAATYPRAVYAGRLY